MGRVSLFSSPVSRVVLTASFSLQDTKILTFSQAWLPTSCTLRRILSITGTALDKVLAVLVRVRHSSFCSFGGQSPNRLLQTCYTEPVELSRVFYTHHHHVKMEYSHGHCVIASTPSLSKTAVIE